MNGQGLVAVGRDHRFGDQDRADRTVAWTSPDGIVWSRTAHDEMDFGSGEIHVVTAGGAGLVAIGEADDTGPLVWVAVPPD